MSASVGFLPLQEYFDLSVSTFVPHNNQRNLNMKEDRGRDGSRGEGCEEKRMRKEEG